VGEYTPSTDTTKEQEMTVGERIKRQRQRLGMSLRDLEARSGVSRGFVSRLERNERTQLGLEVAKQLAQALGVTVDYLAGMYEEADKEETSEFEPAAVDLVGA
jgi:transcriptional regulator with XRE-family HTH domain